MKITRYAIKNKEGMFSTGGTEPLFVDLKKAKIWKTLGQVKNHLNIFSGFEHLKPPPDWTIVEVTLVDSNTVGLAVEIFETREKVRLQREAKQKFENIVFQRKKLQEELDSLNSALASFKK